MIYFILCRPLNDILLLVNIFTTNRFNDFLSHTFHLPDTLFFDNLKQTVDICELLIILTQLPLFSIDGINLCLELIILLADI
jgi:hypothetical protein